jgi:hypothetical protein
VKFKWLTGLLRSLGYGLDEALGRHHQDGHAQTESNPFTFDEFHDFLIESAA